MVRQVPEQLEANEFANMVEQNFFASPHEVMETPRVLSESDWQKDQFLMGIKRLKANKPADEIKHVAELLYFVFNDFFD